MPSVNRLVPLLLVAQAALAQNGTSRPETSTPGTATAALGHSQTELGGPFVPLMNMTLGNPPQDVTAVFDTGSADLIVPDPRGGFCKQPSSNCEPVQDGGNGAFDQKNSTNVSDVGSVLRTGFANGESEEGNFIKAPGAVGGAPIEDLQFGLIKAGRPGPDTPEASLLPILGVASPSSETDSTDRYSNLPARMKEVGAINSRIVSVYTNDFRGNDGSVTFGGVDKKKFTGELKEAPMVPPPKVLGRNKAGPEGKDNAPPGDPNDIKGGQDEDGGQAEKGTQKKEDDKGKNGRAGQDKRSWRNWNVRGPRRRIIVKRDEPGNQGDPDNQGDQEKGEKGNEDNKGPGKDDGGKDSEITDFFVELSSVNYIPDSGEQGQKQDPDDDKKEENKDAEAKEREGEKNGSETGDKGDDKGSGNEKQRNGYGQRKKENRDKKGDDKGEAKVNKDGSVSLLAKGEKAAALIDTGNPESQVPETAARGLAKQLGAKFDEQNGGIGTFDCKMSKGSLRFGFNGDKAKIDVPIEMMLVPKEITRQEGCDVAITAGDPVSLGSPFLQAAYVVFDDENKRLMFAQAVINTTSSDIEAVGAKWNGTMKGTG